MPDPRVTDVVRFGEFELDVRAGELRKSGARLNLTEQPCQLLSALLERPNELVTRDELRQRLWPGDTFVDFEHGLNAAVKRLRDVLGDSAETPRFVETLPRRGYRFIAPIEPIDPTIVPVPMPAPSTRSWRMPAVAALVVIVGAGALLVKADVRRMIDGQARLRTVAVLPVANRSGDATQEYFADGITDHLIAGLAKIDGLRVTSRTSVMTYKVSPPKLKTIGADLKVEAVLEGSVAPSGSGVTLTFGLFDTATDTQLWSATYERDVQDLPMIQQEVAEQVARSMGVPLSADDRARLKPGRPLDPAAFDAYVRGRYFWNRRGPADLQRAADEFLHAIEKDPNYGEAYAGLSDAYAQMGYSNLKAPHDAFPKAKAAADKATSYAPHLAEGHAALGFVHMYYDFDFEGAEREYRQAIALNDKSVTAHHGYSILLTALLRPGEARRQIEHAYALDPLSPLVATDLGFETFYDRRYDDARVALEDAIKLAPDGPLAHYWLGRTLQAQGHVEDAIKEFQKSYGMFTGSPALGGLGNLYGRAGRRTEALQSLEKLKTFANVTYPIAYQNAVVYAGLGDREQALTWLQRAYDDRVGNGIVWLLKDPRWDPLRGERGFEAIVQQVGFPVSSRARAPHSSARPD